MDNLLMTDEKMLSFPEMRSKLYKHYYEYGKMKTAEMKYTLLPDGKFKEIFLKINGDWILVCGTKKSREFVMKDTYEYIKYNLKCDKVIECGIGIGKILDYLNYYDLQYEIIEINKTLAGLFEPNGVIYGDFFEYIKNKQYNNSIFIIRTATIWFKDAREYAEFIIKNFKNKKKNYLFLECPKLDFKLDGLLYQQYNRFTKTYSYIIYLGD